MSTPDDTPKQSDQMPEEGPAHQVPDDAPERGEGAARESGRDQAQRHGHNPHEPRHKAPELSRAEREAQRR
ncbi:MAG: hypothetical protein ACYCU0_00015 [Solirubrobacteraceae bacterium]